MWNPLDIKIPLKISIPQHSISNHVALFSKYPNLSTIISHWHRILYIHLLTSRHDSKKSETLRNDDEASMDAVEK